MEQLIKECQDSKDSNDEFEAWNSGKNVTTAKKVSRMTRHTYRRQSIALSTSKEDIACARVVPD